MLRSWPSFGCPHTLSALLGCTASSLPALHFLRADAMLDLPPCTPEQPLVNATVAKHIIGQAIFQLSILYYLVFHGQQGLGVDAATCNTLVFNSFVLMQLFNQLNCRKVRGGGVIVCTCCVWEREAGGGLREGGGGGGVLSRAREPGQGEQREEKNDAVVAVCAH